MKQYGAITIHAGCNNWEQPQQVQMKEIKGRFKANGKAIKAVKGAWWQKAEIDVPDDAYVMDMVFSDGGQQYDNNNRADFMPPLTAPRRRSSSTAGARLRAVLPARRGSRPAREDRQDSRRASCGAQEEV